MTENLGTLLRNLRKARGLTLEQAALAAGLARSTVNRWETAATLPRLVELNLLLEAFGVTTQQKRLVIARVDAPRAQKQARVDVRRVAEMTGIGPCPSGGDLLRALRQRQGLSACDVADQMGISMRTLQRWERAEVWPATEPLHSLCYLLKAQEEEITALTIGSACNPLWLSEANPSLDFLEQQLKALGQRISQSEPALELHCLALEAQLWPQAASKAQGRRLLAQAYSEHARYLGYRARVDTGKIAKKALDLMPDKSNPDRYGLKAGVLAACQGKQNTKQALASLRHWLALARHPDIEAWILSIMAGQMASDGAMEAALELSEQACDVARRSRSEAEVGIRQCDQASLFLTARRPDDALKILENINDDIPAFTGELYLLRAEARREVKDHSEARDWLQRAIKIIETYKLTHLHDRVEMLKTWTET